jgi:zinc transport system substrate-binding protein
MLRYTISFIAASLLGFPALADAPRVITDIPPVHSLVSMVMGNVGSPVLLLDRGADPHSFQLRPSQASEIAGADLVVWIGPELTPWLDRAITNLSADVMRLTLLSAEGTGKRTYGAAAGHDHEAEAHSDHATEGDVLDDHDHSGTDPHAWLDPENAKLWIGLIAAELARLDPENTAIYNENAKNAQAEVEAMNSAIAQQLAPTQGMPFVVFHDAYSYFTGHFGLNVAGTIAMGDAAAPGAAQLAELRTVIEEGKAICIFPEAAHDPKQVALMAEGTGIRIGAALEPEGSTMEPGPDLYDALMRGLAGTLTDCLLQEG